MTCVVAYRSRGKVWMGADSLGVDSGYSRESRSDPKIYRVGDMLIGFTSSFRMGQLLGFSLTPPDHDPRDSLMKYMATSFINAVRTCLKDGGYTTIENSSETGGCFIVAHQGRIFTVHEDFQVGERTGDYTAVGCGEDLAMGAMYAALKVKRDIPPEKLLTVALEAAEEYSAGVGGAYLIESI